jgi:hypothetical protein
MVPSFNTTMLQAALGVACLVYLASISIMQRTVSCNALQLDASSGNPVPNQYMDTRDDASDAYVRDHYNRNYELWELRPLFEMWTMTSELHMNAAVGAILQINERRVPGDIVECGVWKGGMSMGMIFANMRHNTDRHFWLFDTFEGLPPPTEKDEDRAHKVWEQVKKGDPTVNDFDKHRVEDGKWNYGALELVKSNVYYTHYPRENIHFVKGKVEDTLPSTTLPEKIALLRLDTDFYLSTKAEMEYLWDRIVPGGLLIVDDFCTWGGSREAVIEFFDKKLGVDAVKLISEPPCLHYWKSNDTASR